jgi:hypothetical protein
MCKKFICLVPCVLALSLAASVSADILSDPSLIIYYCSITLGLMDRAA